MPHHATEEELTQIFNKFGTVVELRIHSKSGPKVPGVRAPPNYGFITYDDPESVQNCLAHMVSFMCTFILNYNSHFFWIESLQFSSFALTILLRPNDILPPNSNI